MFKDFLQIANGTQTHECEYVKPPHRPAFDTKEISTFCSSFLSAAILLYFAQGWSALWSAVASLPHALRLTIVSMGLLGLSTSRPSLRLPQCVLELQSLSSNTFPYKIGWIVETLENTRDWFQNVLRNIQYESCWNLLSKIKAVVDGHSW